MHTHIIHVQHTIQVHTRIQTRVRTHTHICTCVYTLTYIHMHTHNNMCAHTNIHTYTPEEDGTRHVINDFIWEMSIRTISTKVEDVSHKLHDGAERGPVDRCHSKWPPPVQNLPRRKFTRIVPPPGGNVLGHFLARRKFTRTIDIIPTVTLV